MVIWRTLQMKRKGTRRGYQDFVVQCFVRDMVTVKSNYFAPKIRNNVVWSDYFRSIHAPSETLCYHIYWRGTSTGGNKWRACLWWVLVFCLHIRTYMLRGCRSLNHTHVFFFVFISPPFYCSWIWSVTSYLLYNVLQFMLNAKPGCMTIVLLMSFH